MLPSLRPRGSRERRENSIGWRMAGLAMQTSSEVIAGALIGWVVDRYFQTGRKGLLVGAICGIIVGLSSLIRGAVRANSEFDAPRRGADEQPGGRR